MRSPTRAAARAGAAAVDRLVRVRPGGGFEARLAGARLLRALDRHGDTRIDVSRPGRALLAGAPDALARLRRRLDGPVVVVSATNGKTTTTHLTAAVLSRRGAPVVANRAGANMAGGVVAELVAASRASGRLAAEAGVFEVDELWLDQVVDDLAPDVVVLGNLFRDQLDRVGEIDRVAARWRALVEATPAGRRLVFATDDPRVAALGEGWPGAVGFGIGLPAWSDGRLAPAADVPDCPHCDTRLAVTTPLLGHLGGYQCPACGWERPSPAVVATEVELRGLAGSRFTLTTPTGSAPVELRLPGRFNVCNAVAAAAAGHACGVAAEELAAGLAATVPAFGRGEAITAGGTRLLLLLAKNPTGLDEIAHLLAAGAEPGSVDLVVCLNDADLDGRDVSWVWDADLERLAPSLRRVTCGGRRAADAALRLACAGVPRNRLDVVDGVGAALERAVAPGASPLPVVANYTAMLELRELLAERGHAARYWR